MVVDGGPFSMSVVFRKQRNKEGMMPLMVDEALSVLWQEPPFSIECTASCGTRSSALNHLPESVAGTAVFDPMPRVGSAVGSNEVQLWSMKGGASIPPCTSGTIFRSGKPDGP
jgi:hypothetical protein